MPRNGVRPGFAIAKEGAEKEGFRDVTQARNRAKDQKRLDAALARLAAAGYVRSEPALLQPAGVFLDRLGEDFRGRLYLTGEGGGADFCLRPEYTIPVSLDYLASPLAGEPADIAYGGPIFRAGWGERPQTGLESFGRSDREAADAEILSVALETAAAAGAPPLAVRLGDAGLTRSFLDGLDLPAAWRRRIDTGLARGASLARILAPFERRSGDKGSGVLAALEKVDAADARKLVEDLLAIAGISTVGGRSAGEIAERFLEQASLEDGAGVGVEKRRLIEAFFAVEATPDAARDRLRRLGAEAKIDLDAALDSFDTRTGFLAAHGIRVEEIVFSARFPHAIDYYSGFMFEARPLSEDRDTAPVVSGGRYDALLRTLGAREDIPAVGAAIFVDRLGEDA
jgi:ATP phosphoribosyltransferase regulatory subunit